MVKWMLRTRYSSSAFHNVLISMTGFRSENEHLRINNVCRHYVKFVHIMLAVGRPAGPIECARLTLMKERSGKHLCLQRRCFSLRNHSRDQLVYNFMESIWEFYLGFGFNYSLTPKSLAPCLNWS